MPKYVKKRPLSERVKSAPQDWFLQLMEEYETFDWEGLQLALSWPTALALNGIYVLVKAIRSIDSTPDVSTLKPVRDSAFIRRTRDTWLGDSVHFWLDVFEFLLIAVSLCNTAYLFSQRKTYQLMHTDPKVLGLRGSSARTPNLRRTDLDYEAPLWSLRFPGKFLWPIWRRFGKGGRRANREIYEMSMWDPYVFSLNIFCWFSPPQVAIMWAMDGHNFHYFLPIAFLVGVQIQYVSNAYTTLLKDKQILFGQVYHEYNTKFVNRRVFVKKFDQCTSTETQADFPFEEEIDEDYQEIVSSSSDSDEEVINNPGEFSPADKPSAFKSSENPFQRSR
ncbi:hypothetical protein K493DRAFT_316504 [Basidiobolus meristosporus CBS 931.73]|uniref:Nuclear rim protein 1 n=1 Tax=Basidiobolus meristosporus CBS 931.73 TaxID=1314790 RepID=A0A1Y1Y4P1_9FUNG|nr:hypothetical protein K493DRAFT_316504 [Basidiobolus meristosporus CBS 931.73]|eukprot:ORX92574.1 hypothetical protein K493DRAFT_316504 [Basidiobolus meristosporus CBS 931.73]